MDCLFCRIVAGTIPVKIIFEDEQVLVFPDISPQAPVHLLIIPKKHVDSLAAVAEGSGAGTSAAIADQALAGHMMAVAAQVAGTEGLGGGYRVVINTGVDGGQTVAHLHLHLLGGRPMHWPPG